METMAIGEFKIKMGKRIRQLRKAAKLSQEKLAIKAGCKDKQIISEYEVNGANPTAYTLMQLAPALNVAINELFDFSDLPE
ncbi:helix-turn-helix domain-containing protein [Parapedobacter sp. GCM10030251]|jgi:Predicted transcriptional regulators|uniref:helix-turn-helix domain-containing protein n=1 Tax=Parapedobacter sp. GCM10030251 TaxID=3273419 RepID=UPI0036145F3A